MKRNKIHFFAIFFVLGIFVLFSCNNSQSVSQEFMNESDENLLKTETIHEQDSNAMVYLTLDVELPLAESEMATQIRQQLCDMLAKRLTHVASFENEQFFSPYQGDMNDTHALVVYYREKLMSLFNRLTKEEAAQRADYIMENEEMTDGERMELIDEFPAWEYSYTLKKIADTLNYVVFDSYDYIYMGGAHGGVGGDGCLTFNKEDGRLVEKFLDPHSVKDLQPQLIAGLLSYYSDGANKMTETELFERLQIEGNIIPFPQFAPYPTKEGLVFTYQQYEIACYADGMPCFVIPYDALAPYLTDEARKVCQPYLTASEK